MHSKSHTHPILNISDRIKQQTYGRIKFAHFLVTYIFQLGYLTSSINKA
jgi:hypothetical protein